MVCSHNNAFVARGIRVTRFYCGRSELRLNAIYIVSSVGTSLSPFSLVWRLENFNPFAMPNIKCVCVRMVLLGMCVAVSVVKKIMQILCVAQNSWIPSKRAKDFPIHEFLVFINRIISWILCFNFVILISGHDILWLTLRSLPSMCSLYNCLTRLFSYILCNVFCFILILLYP